MKQASRLPVKRRVVALRRVIRFCAVFLGCVSLSVMNSHLVNAQAKEPARVSDVLYGESLYAFYQGHFFEALSLLKVAELRGGVKGHGDHPKLVEGGLMLSYGMVASAKTLFEATLKEQLTVNDKNLAWFYLGKVFYLQQDYAASLASFKHIEQAAFAAAKQDQYHELLYLRAQIAYLTEGKVDSSLIAGLPQDHIYPFYLRFNQAVGQSQTNTNKALAEFTSLAQAIRLKLNTLKPADAIESPDRTEVLAQEEWRALLDQTLLASARLQLQLKQPEAAFESIQKIDKKGMFAAQALFLYSVAATQLGQYPQSLAALEELKKLTHFNPWQQQSVYALAYLYEQMGEADLAVQAYRIAVTHFETLQEKLATERQKLNEAYILEALQLSDSIGQPDLNKDAYGRIKPGNHRFYFSHLLASERFQIQLSELHELYILKNSLNRWALQLNSFDGMLATREQARQQKLSALAEELADKNVALWQQKTALFKANIEAANETHNAYFFMDAEQLAYYKRIQATTERLNALPDAHPEKSRYQTRLNRARAYFDWWIADQYPINRWRTLKSLKLLEREMQAFTQRYTALQSEQVLDEQHRMYQQRLVDGMERLNYLENAVQNSIAKASGELQQLVDQAMQTQINEIGVYLLAAREALARVSDQQFRRAAGVQEPVPAAVPSSQTTPESVTGDQP